MFRLLSLTKDGYVYNKKAVIILKYNKNRQKASFCLLYTSDAADE